MGGNHTPAGFLTCSMKSAEGKSSAGVRVNVAHCTVWSETPAKFCCGATWHSPHSQAGI